jgi:N-acetylglutamate synthase-like GNAT family acetyltransferase
MCNIKQITLRPATAGDIPWINQQYREIGFVLSEFDTEFIVIANVGNRKAGIGRLVRIDDFNAELGGIYVLPDFRRMGVAEEVVGYLCDNNPFKQVTLWCLPFENLGGFYAKFGFTEHREGPVPKAVRNKLDWCNTGGKYDQKVILLSVVRL